MKTNVNLVSSRDVLVPCFPDGTRIACRVDRFPSDNPAYKKRDGFRCNDVSLLDRLSFGVNFDEDLARIVASRVKELPVDKPQNISEQDMIALLRPAYVQTASEIKSWDERVYQYMSLQGVDSDAAAAAAAAAKASEVVAVDSSDESKNDE